MLKILLSFGLLVSSIIEVFPQVKGISYTFSPTSEYIFSHKNSGMDNSLAVGGQIGFGFGEYVQLSANYVQTIGSKTDFSTLLGYKPQFSEKDLSLSRLGGEFKVNLTRSRIIPYLTLGTGVQTISTDNTDNSNQIYLASGAGFKIKLADRLNLGFEVLNTNYRINPVNSLLTASERSGLAAGSLPGSSDIASDISAKVNLSIFMGGKRPGTLSDLDMAYLEQFSNGFKGLSVALEPTVMRIDFSQKLPFTDAWYTGISTGFDFGPYVGIRGFYLRSMEDGSITSFGKSVIWGGETKFKLNSSQGLIPYLTLGGGRIDALKDYDTPNGMVAENKAFASGGLGLEIPLSRNIKIGVFTKALVTSMQDVDNLTNPEDLVTNMSYGAKIGFLIGKKPEAAQHLLDRKIDEIKDEYTNIQEQERNEIVSKYEAQLKKRDTEIKLKETELKQKQATLDSLKKVKELKVKEIPAAPEAPEVIESTEKSSIRVTPEELISIIRELKAVPGTNSVEIQAIGALAKDSVVARIADKIDPIKNIEGTVQVAAAKTEKTPVATSEEKAVVLTKAVSLKDSVVVVQTTEKLVNINDSVYSQMIVMFEEMKSMNERIISVSGVVDSNTKQIQSILTVLKDQMVQNEKLIHNFQNGIDAQESAGDRMDDRLKDLKNMNESIDNLAKQVRKLENKIEKTNVTDADEPVSEFQAVEAKATESENKVEPESSKLIVYNNSAVFGGLNLGESNSFNVGLSWKYSIPKTSINIIPEAYIGFGASAYFGLFVNGTYDLNLGSVKGFEPYVGTGLGVLKTKNSQDEDVFKATHNIIIGSQLPKFSNGRFYVDFTIRNLFKYNQLTLGYNLPF